MQKLLYSSRTCMSLQDLFYNKLGRAKTKAMQETMLGEPEGLTLPGRPANLPASIVVGLSIACVSPASTCLGRDSRTSHASSCSWNLVDSRLLPMRIRNVKSAVRNVSVDRCNHITKPRWGDGFFAFTCLPHSQRFLVGACLQYIPTWLHTSACHCLKQLHCRAVDPGAWDVRTSRHGSGGRPERNRTKGRSSGATDVDMRLPGARDAVVGTAAIQLHRHHVLFRSSSRATRTWAGSASVPARACSAKVRAGASVESVCPVQPLAATHVACRYAAHATTGVLRAAKPTRTKTIAGTTKSMCPGAAEHGPTRVTLVLWKIGIIGVVGRHGATDAGTSRK